MNIDEIYAGDALKASDLKGKDVTVTISKTELAEFDDGDRKPRLHFEKTEKTFVINKTNANAISSMYGPDTDNWHGKKITLFPTQTDFQGRIVACIRVKLSQTDLSDSQAPIQARQEQQPPQDTFGEPESPIPTEHVQTMSQQLDDEIPF